MKTPRATFWLAAVLGFQLCFCGEIAQAAGKRGTAFEIGLGETLSPQMLRLSIADYDVTLSAMMFGFGNRFWLGNNYVSAGLGIHDSIGFYGGIGHEFNPLSIFIISLDFQGFGDISGQAMAQGYLNIGVRF